MKRPYAGSRDIACVTGRDIACVTGLAWLVLVSGCAPSSPVESVAEVEDVPSTGASTESAPVVREATIVLGGDLLWHDTTWASAQQDARAAGLAGSDDYDFGPMFGSMAPVISDADLAICNQEIPLAPAGGPYHNYPSFAAPPQVAAGIAEAGYDLCTIASNHSLDQGVEGIATTVAAMEEAGVATTGAYSTEESASQPTIVTTDDGIRVAVVAGTYGLNGYQPPADQPWVVDEIDTEEMIDKARAARDQGADLVLASVHDGTEYVTEPTEQQRTNAQVLVESGQFDLVYGHHAHTVQPWERLDDTWVVYGLGNQIAQQRARDTVTYEGITARFTFRDEGDGDFAVTEAEAIPTLVTSHRVGEPIRLVHVSAALADEALVPEGTSPERLEEARTRTMEAVRSLGAEGITTR